MVVVRCVMCHAYNLPCVVPCHDVVVVRCVMCHAYNLPCVVPCHDVG